MPKVTVEGESIDFAFDTPDVGGPDHSAAIDASRLVAPIQVDYGSTEGLALKLLCGWPEVRTAPNGRRYIWRSLPYAYPGVRDFQELPWLYCVGSQRSEGVSPEGRYTHGGARYSLARMWMVFSSLPYRVRPNTSPLLRVPGGPLGDETPDEATLERYVSVAFEPVDRTVTAPRGLGRWVPEPGDPDYDVSGQRRPEDAPPPPAPPGNYSPADPRPGPAILEPLGRPEPCIDVVVTHYQLPALPLAKIAMAIGRVNAAPFSVPRQPPLGGAAAPGPHLFPAETLLMGAPRIREYRSVRGQPVWDVQFRFRALLRARRTPGEPAIAGWNHAMRFIGGGTYDYRRLTVNGKPGGDRPLATYDFAELFRPE